MSQIIEEAAKQVAAKARIQNAPRAVFGKLSAMWRPAIAANAIIACPALGSRTAPQIAAPIAKARLAASDP
jgi:hypothetical protein